MRGCYGTNPIRRAAQIAAAALVLSGFGCANSRSAESKFAGDTAAERSETVTERVEEGPSKTTILEFEPPRSGGGAPGRDPSVAATDSLPAHGPLVKATIIDRAPATKTTETKSEAHQEASVQAEGASQSASKPSLGLLVWPWLLGLAGAALAAFLVWRLKPSWLGAALAAVRALFGLV